jgi:hypothetical protein
VARKGLENRQARKGLVGSNPTPSANVFNELVVWLTTALATRSGPKLGNNRLDSPATPYASAA